MAGISSKSAGKLENKFKVTGKELQHLEFSDETGLEEYDFGARFLDPQIGRWSTIDPRSESNRRSTPYNYVLNNPLRYIDPDGMEEKDHDGPYGTSLDELRDQNAAVTIYRDDENSTSKKNKESKDGDKKQTKKIELSVEKAESVKNILEKSEFIEIGFEYSKTTPFVKGALQKGALTIKTSNGVITLMTTSKAFNGIIKGLNFSGNIAVGMDVALNVNAYNNNEISGERLNYRLLGITAATATPYLYGAIIGSSGGPVGILSGLTVGASFHALEMGYDDIFTPFKNTLIEGISKLENALKSGRINF